LNESAAMLEIRKIRDENSLRRLSQTTGERKKESKETMDWFINVFGKSIKTIRQETHS